MHNAPFRCSRISYPTANTTSATCLLPLRVPIAQRVHVSPSPAAMVVLTLEEQTSRTWVWIEPYNSVIVLWCRGEGSLCSKDGVAVETSKHVQTPLLSQSVTMKHSVRGIAERVH